MKPFIIMSAFMAMLIIILGFLLFKRSISAITSIFTKMERPFLTLYQVGSDGTETPTNILFITHPFSKDETSEIYNSKITEGFRFIGMTSYSEFPGRISNPHDRFSDKDDMAWKFNYNNMVDGWCHCFREPNIHIAPGKPRLLLSESDFANSEIHKPDPGAKPEYDFLYVCLKDNDKCTEGWQSYNRNWQMAKRMLGIMCEEFGLRGLLIGRINCEIPSGCHNLMEMTDFQDYNKFILNYSKCKFLFVPNITDASPRVVTEAMCYNLPVFMNVDILGGWKYIVPGTTGEFFANNVEDFAQSLRNFLEGLEDGMYTPRDFFTTNYGARNSGRKLLEFVRDIYGNKSFPEADYLKPGV